MFILRSKTGFMKSAMLAIVLFYAGLSHAATGCGLSNIFTIDNREVSLLAPNGGEVLVAGSSYPISWSSSGISDVLIEYSTNNGGNWTPVDPCNTGNTGSYNWTVPWVSLDQCLVQVSDASDPCTSDTSDATFTIRLGTIYVDDVTDPLEDGSAAHPFDTIQEGIDAAFDGDTVIVLEGTYTGTGNRDIDFGGKAITVRSTDPENPVVVDATIIDCQCDPCEPHRGFYFHSGEGPDSVVSGLTIANGYGPTEEFEGESFSAGGGIFCYYSSPTLDNCTFSGNSAGNGGGMFNWCGIPSITNCTFSGNSAWDTGGGMLNWDSSSSVINCTFSDNSADQGAGGMLNVDSNPSVINCTFSGNSVDKWYADGGAILNYGYSNPTLTNCTFSGNLAKDCGGGMDSYSNSNPTLTNCIFWGNTPDQISGSATVSYSDVQGGWEDGTGNIDADPLFVDADGPDNIAGTEDDNLRLLYGSPCIDAGDPCYIPDPCETDLDGNSRVINGRIDMGAYENQEIRLADLLVTSEDINFGIIPAVPGEPNSILAIVWNIGDISAANIEVSFADSSGPIGTNQTIPIINPGQSATVSIQHLWPDVGFQLITVEVDPFENMGSGREGRGPVDRIEELDETNNTASKVYQIGYPADANAILEVSWNSAPACYIEHTSAVIQGKAEYKIEITGADDIVSAALGSIVTARMIDPNKVVTNLQSTLTGPGGYFYIPFIVPDANDGTFKIEISVTDGTLTGVWEKLFCIQPDIPTPRKDLWICDLTVSDERPDIGDIVTVCATVCASPDNDLTVLNIPVTFYAYPPTGGGYQIGQTQYIDQMARGDSNSVCVDWTPAVNGQHRIRASIGISDDNNGNNYRYYTVVVGMFNVTTSPKWATIGQQVQITVDSREQLPSDQLDSITVLDSASQPIPPFPLYPGNPSHPSPTRWVYQTDSLPEGTALGTATITVTGTDSGSVQHTGEGYFKVYEVVPDFWVHSCDISFSDLNPDLGEPITIDAVVHADSSNPETETDIPVTFYSKHLPSGGEYIEIYQTQYTGDIVAGGVSTPVSVPWQNAAKGEYVIKVQLGPGFSDRNNGNNAATRAILVGDNIPFDVEFEVVNKTRIGRWEFVYDCNVIMHNQTGLTLENVELELTGVSSNMTIVNPPYTAIFTDIGPNGSALSENVCTFSVNRLEEIDSGQIHWDLIYQIVDICGIMKQASTSVILFDPIVLGDITGEGAIDILDLLLLARDWLHNDSIADIAPAPYGDDIVNLADFAVLAQHWTEATEQ